MHRIQVVLIFCWLGCLSVFAEIIPVPESEQAARALAIVDAWQNPRPAMPPKKLHVVYFTPADRDPAAGYEQRLTAIMNDIQSFYRDGMMRNGFGPRTFPLVKDAQGNLVIHLVKGREPAQDYRKPDGDKVVDECRPVLQAAGISFDDETILIFCNLADWDEKAHVFSHHSPYYGMWNQTGGLCFVVDAVIQNIDDLTKNEPQLNDDEYGNMTLGKFNTIFIGGIAHELGHALALPHCGERWDEKALGTSLMGVGNHTYREERRGQGKGTFLTMGSAMRLAGRPLFCGADKGFKTEPVLQECDLLLTTNLTRPDLKNRRAALRVEGVVRGTPPVYGVIAYFNSRGDDGYFSPSATSVPDASGHFAIEVSDLEPCEHGELRVQFCHANGAASERQLTFRVDDAGRVDLSEWQMRRDLAPVAEAVAANEKATADKALQSLEASDATEFTKTVGRNLVATLDQTRKPSPAEVEDSVTHLSLGDARPESAKVGWLQPMANRVPLDPGVRSPILESGRIYATGLFAHAPSSYVFDLGGKWKEFAGQAGLHTLQQPYGSVVFVIKADDKEVFRSNEIRQRTHANFQVNVQGVRKLELIVEPTADGNHNDWGLWLDPIISR